MKEAAMLGVVLGAGIEPFREALAALEAGTATPRQQAIAAMYIRASVAR